MKRMVVARGGKRGKTSGRGGKGQSARAGNKRRPEWRDIIKRVPKLRGRGKNSNKGFAEIPFVINLSILESVFSANDEVTPTTLLEKGIITTSSGRTPIVKILGDGELTKAFKISGLYISESAKEKIEKVGGTVTFIKEKVIAKPVKSEKIKVAKEVIATTTKTEPNKPALVKKVVAKKEKQAKK